MNRNVARVEEKILKHFGSTTSERRAKMRAVLEAKYGADFDETVSDIGETLMLEVLTPDEHGTMLIDDAEEISQWLYENFIA